MSLRGSSHASTVQLVLMLTLSGFCVEARSDETLPNAIAQYSPHLADHAKVPEGFTIEKILEVPKDLGSWVALTVDPQGRLLASDQGNKGLFLVTPGSDEQPTQVVQLPVDLSAAQGLLYAWDALYVVVNGGSKSGLHRVVDTNGDGLPDSAEHCMFLQGGGEHGPHAVVLAPDGKSLFVASGNHTQLPSTLADSRIPQNWQEDHLLPRRWDANGHAAGILAPGGWICQVDPTGKNWSVYSMGYRNQYDIAFNAEGELFTYDADMEWDFGSPWYRPTRVVHATSGSEFGWRSGTGKWPEYYEDSLPAALNIGPGSPTGIVFGYGAKFPAKYQQALFLLDWTYSTIYAVHLTPQGSTYTATSEDFVTGSPLPVTDAVIGPDGTMYFAVGGRGTQSAIYRVRYVGGESVAPVSMVAKENSQHRELRRQLEGFQGTLAASSVSDSELELIFKNLGNSDRFIRYSARIALEFQPTSRWRSSVLSLTDPVASISGLLALARQGVPQDINVIVERLLRLPHEGLDHHSQLAALRTLQVALARRAESSDLLQPELKDQLLSLLESVYPTGDYSLDAEIVQLLVHLESQVVVERTLEMMDQLGPESIPDWGHLISRSEAYGGTVGAMLQNMPPVRAIHFAFVLRNAKAPWTLEQRRRYFSFFIQAAKHPGGASYGKFLEQFREDALSTCSDSEKVALEDVIGQSLIAAPVESTPPEGPGRKWTTAEAITELGSELRKRNYDRGRNLFHATTCAKCHRMAGEGGAIGPDLSTAGKKFSLPDLVDAIVDPSRVISDQYGSHQIVTADGEVLIGRAVKIGDQWHLYKPDPNAIPVVLEESDIESMMPSMVSQMPEGLVDSLNAEELRDLIAYILAAGDRGARVYK